MGLLGSRRPRPSSALGCCTLQQRPSTTRLGRFGVQLQVWLQNKSFLASATVTRGEHQGSSGLVLSVEIFFLQSVRSHEVERAP